MYLKKDVPNFIFKNVDALIDMGCIIEEELPEIGPSLRVETKIVRGRHGTLHKTYGDYDSFDYPIKKVSIPYDNLEEVKRWLRGAGRLITHNDPDKYMEAYARMNRPIEFTNEWGVFYTFDILFECQPLRRKVNENFIPLSDGENPITNHGTEPSSPYFELESQGGDISIVIDNETFTLLNTKQGLITLDCELGLAIFDGSNVKTRGKWPRMQPDSETIIKLSNVTSAKMKIRSVWS